MFGNYMGKLILASETTPPPVDDPSLWDKLTAPNSDGLVQEFLKGTIQTLGKWIFDCAAPFVS